MKKMIFFEIVYFIIMSILVIKYEWYEFAIVSLLFWESLNSIIKIIEREKKRKEEDLKKLLDIREKHKIKSS
jgi:hypothetical protein